MLLKVFWDESVTGFNVNCSDCFYHAITSHGQNVCYNPRYVMMCGGNLYPIEDINQNIDCQYFEKLSPMIDE